MKPKLRIVYRTPRLTARCQLCAGTGAVFALSREPSPNEYSFRCGCDAGDDLPSWVPTWSSDVHGGAFRPVTATEFAGSVRLAMIAGVDAGPPGGVSAPRPAAVNGPQPARHWQETD